MTVLRFDNNPLISPSDLKPTSGQFEIIGTFNPGAIRYRGEVLLLIRVAERPLQEPGYVTWPILNCEASPPRIELQRMKLGTEGLNTSDPRVVVYRNRVVTTSISHFRLARSRDGRNFTVDAAPVLTPSEPYEELGIEDPRITQIGDTFYINYSAISRVGITTALISTKDFKTFTRLGPIFHPDNKDVAIFPEKVGGKYWAFHRPHSNFGGPPAMWLAESEDLVHWGNHRYLMGPREGLWDCGRIGCSCVPIRTDRGWLELYHGATEEVYYCLGAVLLDLENPAKILSRPDEPILEPKAVYETQGFCGKVCFACGHVEGPDGALFIYYGGADTCVCGAETSLKDLMAGL